MLSVPPATIAWPLPPLIRSAAKAIAWRPEAQNRLIGDGRCFHGKACAKARDACHVQPCSASGIAQPSMTSSISDPRSAGRRFSASRMTVSRQLVGPGPRNAPAGALPTGVRTADDDHGISPSKSCSRSSMASPTSLALAVEKMVRAVDDDQLFRFVRAARRNG